MIKEDEKDRASSTRVRNKNSTFSVSVGTHSYDYMWLTCSTRIGVYPVAEYDECTFMGT